jgi:hypothetical protein
MSIVLFIVIPGLTGMVIAFALRARRMQREAYYWRHQADAFSEIAFGRDDEADAWCRIAMASTYKRQVLPDNEFGEAA